MTPDELIVWATTQEADSLVVVFVAEPGTRDDPLPAHDGHPFGLQLEDGALVARPIGLAP